MNDNSCRICFTTDIQSPLFPIHLRNNVSSPSEKLKRLNLRIEGGSSLICSQCIQELDHAVNFIEMCEKSNQIIATRLKNTCQSGECDLSTKDLEVEAAEIVEEISESQCLKTDTVLIPKPQCPHCGSQRRCKHWAPPTTHTCPYCKKEFNRKFNFNVHLKRHLGDSDWPCPACGSGQASRWRAQRHCRPRARRACPHPACRRSFTTVTNLNNHIRTHTGERPFSCEECGKSFSSKNTLTVHLRIHTGEKPYMCPVCGKQFANNKLSEHLASHAGETHPCPVDNCNKTFKSARSLRFHAAAHGCDARPARAHACAQCGARYAHTQSLRKHLRKRHAQSPEETLHPSNKQQGQMEVSTSKINERILNC